MSSIIPIRSRRYVFVVCGSAEHINTLHFSLQMLKKRTRYEIIIITDCSRNEIAILHDRIIDVSTPTSLSHHQASIYLKTSLHKILPPAYLYCYLDTDVVAIRPDIDTIFTYFQAPITFCTDHCKIKAFSPNAVHDPFYDNLIKKQEQLSDLYYRYKQEDEKQIIAAGAHLHQILQLKEEFNHNRPLHSLPLQGNRFIQILVSKILFQSIRLFTQLLVNKNQQIPTLEKWHRRIFHVPLDFDLLAEAHGYQYDIATRKWYNLEGQFLYEENLIINRIENQTEFRWDTISQQWYDQDGNNISTIESNKLIVLIKEKLGVEIKDERWQHWNGGVFLFDDSAAAFMEQWHQWTLAIFEDPAWKTRDQGTLIATAWKLGMERHPTLPIAYNLIADYYHPHLFYKGNLTFDIEPHHINIQPYFLHIYHHWNDSNWQVWRDVAQLGQASDEGTIALG